MERIDKVDGTFRRHEEQIQYQDVSPAVIKRLPRYHRYLGELIRQEKLRISSAELSRIMGVTASQIRQDLNCFGGFGQQGYGYNVKYLYGKISELLGTTEGYTAVIVGAGNLGRALAATHMFERRGITRLCLFDTDPAIVGKQISGLTVYHVEGLVEYCREHKVDIGVLTVPKDAATEVAAMLVEGGVKGIWNFANMELEFNIDGVIVENMHMGDSLMKLSYEIKSRSEMQKDDKDE